MGVLHRHRFCGGLLGRQQTRMFNCPPRSFARRVELSTEPTRRRCEQGIPVPGDVNVPGFIPLVGGYWCPKICGLPNTLEGSGSGCCDEDAHCVEQNNPNSRQGCCPSDQRVCAGKCCAKGESCCGDVCCPPGYFCLDGGYCTASPPFVPPSTPPPPPANNCLFGGALCGSKCCPSGLRCCGFLNGQPDCKTSCLH